MLRYFLSLFLLSSPLLAEEPWGVDAELVLAPQERAKEPRNPASRAALLLIRFHQKVISPVDGPRSHYVPSSSAYARDAIVRYGFATGFVMTCDRLIRENSDPWIYPTRDIGGRPLKVDPADSDCK